MVKCVSIFNTGRPNSDGIAVTKAGDLPCKNIIHVIMPSAVDDLKKVVESCLYTAEDKQFSSIALPALGTSKFFISFYFYVYTKIKGKQP